MARLTVAKRIDAPIEAVWASWDDFGNIDRFNPHVRHSRLLSDAEKPTGVGSSRQCDLIDGRSWIRERVVGYRPQNRLKVEVYEGTMPIKSMRATVEFEKISDGRTRVRMTADFEPKFGVVGRLMLPLMKRRFRSLLQDLLDSNAAYVEHGEVVPAAA